MGHIETLEERRLCAAVPTIVRADDGTLVITGTRKADRIAVVEHFPGIGLFDIFINDLPFQQWGGGAIRADGRGGADTISVGITAGPPVTVLGGPGNDTLSGGFGEDVILGGPGRDTLDGFNGNDTLDGGGGNDVINGGPGNDTLTGGGGADTIDGGDGDDTIVGGARRDQLTGGAGADAFSIRDRETEITDLLAEDTRQ